MIFKYIKIRRSNLNSQWIVIVAKNLQLLLTVDHMADIVAGSTNSSLSCSRSYSFFSVTRGEAVYFPFNSGYAFYLVRVLLFDILQSVENCTALGRQAFVDEDFVR